MKAPSAPLRRFHRVAARCQAQLARIVVIPATGNRSHALAYTPLDIEPPQERIRSFWWQTGHIDTGQSGVEGFLLGRFGGAPHSQTEDSTNEDEDAADEHRQCKSCSPIYQLQLRPTTPHPSLYSMRGAMQSSKDFLTAGNESTAAGRIMTMGGTGRQA
jgi:hypothetical protein